MSAEVVSPEIASTSALMLPPAVRAAGNLDWMSAVSTSTSVAVLMVVPLRLTVVVAPPMLAQSMPASPPLDTSSVRPAVVGLSALSITGVTPSGQSTS